MKNLKKILMALLLVALMVSAVATVAIAEASYTGSVEEANALLDKVIAATSSDVNKVADQKAEPLKELYAYLLTVNPEDEGYNEVKEAYNQMTFKVAHSIYSRINGAATLEKKAEAITAVHAYIAAAPVIRKDTEDFAYSQGFVCETCGRYREFTAEEFFDGITDKTVCPGVCTKEQEKLVYATDADKCYSYLTFEKELNDVTLAFAGNIVTYLYGMTEDTQFTSYYDVRAARKAVLDYLDKVSEEEYKPTVSPTYTGDVKVVMAMIQGINEESTFDEVKAALAGAYTYLVETPVMPTVDEYVEFIEKYNELGGLLIKKLAATVDACATPEEKIATIVGFRAYLAGTDDAAGTQISEKVVNLFNQYRNEFIEGFYDAGAVIDAIKELEVAVPEVIYSDDLAAVKAALDAAEALEVNSEEMTAAIKSLYALVSAGALNPTAEEYAAVTERYVALCVKYAKAVYVEPYNAAETIKIEVEIVEDFLAFITEAPLCENVTDMYAEILADVVAKAKAIDDAINANDLPVYKEPIKETVTSVGAVLNSLLDKADAAYADYKTAADDAKAEALDYAITCLTAIGTYIEGNGIDTDAKFYNDFVAGYNATREAIAEELLATVNAADADKKAEALAAVKAYFEKAYMLATSVYNYNMLVADNVTDEDMKAELSLYNVYIELSELFEAITAENATPADVLEYGMELAACEKQYIDVTDGIYVNYIDNRDDVYATIAAALSATVVDLVEKATAEECAVIVSECIAYATELGNKTVIDALNFTLLEEEEDMISLVDSSAKAVYLTVCDKLFAEIAEFDAAETLLDKQAAFKDVFDMYNSVVFANTSVMVGKSYAEAVAAYARVSAELEAAVIEFLNSSTDPGKIIENLNSVYDYVSIVPFSKAVIDTYAAKVQSVKSTDYAAYAGTLIETCGELAYATPENFSAYFARINLALELAYEEYGVNDKFAVAYNILCGFAGVEGTNDYAPKAIDFGSNAFEATFASFVKVKERIIAAAEDSFKNDELADQLVILANLKEFITKYPYSKEIHEFYSDMGYELGGSYRNEAASKAQEFETLATLLHDYIENCPVKQSLLTAVEKSRYQSIIALSEVGEFVVVEAAVDAFENLDGDGLNFIYKNMAADQLRNSIQTYELSEINDSMIASANLKFIFEEFLVKFTEELKSFDAESKAREVAYVGNYIVDNAFPAEFVSLYKSTFGIDSLNAGTYGGSVTAGDLVDLLAKAEAIDLTQNSATILADLAEAVEYFNSHSFSAAGLLAGVEERINAVEKYMEEETAKRIEELEKKSNPEEQFYPIYYDYDHETGAGFTGSMSGTGSHTLVTGDSNKYACLDRPGSGNAFRNITVGDASKGIVIEMDVLGAENLSFQLYESNMNFYMINFVDGQLNYLSTSHTEEYPNYRSGINDPIKVVPGQWMHVGIALDFEARTMELYIDYVSLGKKAMPIAATAGAANFTNLRLNPSKAGAAVSYDNFKMYGGSTYRTLGKTMTAEEEFNNSVAAMLDTNATVVARTRSYYAALALRGLVGDESAEQKVLFDAFDPTEIISLANDAALAELRALAAELDIAKMTTADKDKANATVEKINAYIETNRQVLDQTNEELHEISKLAIEVAEKNAWLSNLVTAVEHLGRFHRATTVASIMKHYNLFKTYYDACELYKPENMAQAESDPVCQKFVTNVAADTSVTDILEEVTFEGYCTVYIPGRMLIHNYYENALKIMDCVSFVKALVADESTFESTEAYYTELIAKARENYDYSETYLSIIRQIVKAGAYDDTVEGVAEALAVYEALDAEFAEIIKSTHYAVIKAELERYNKSNSYIEKAGICVYLENFIAENNVDLTDEEGIQYATILEIYKAELPTYKEDYEAVLNANTEAFIAIVKKMESYVTYKDIKPLYDEAMNNYYYSMNVDSDEARAAVETFVKYQDMINEWETAGAMFLGYVSELKSARRQSQKFRALVNCMNYVDSITEDMQGIAAALKTYTDTLAAYNAEINVVNSELAEVSDAVCSLRTHTVSATILAILQSMMN